MDSDTTARARRLGSVAMLAKPVQHEINNLLTVVLANLDLLRRSAAEGAPRRQLDRVGEATRRLETSTRALLSLARRPVPDPAPFSPATVIAALQPLLALLVPSPGALVVAPLAEDGARVAGDRAAFEDALVACAAALPPTGRLEIACTEAAGVVEVAIGFGGAVPDAAIAALAMLDDAVAADGDGRVRFRLPSEQPVAASG